MELDQEVVGIEGINISRHWYFAAHFKQENVLISVGVIRHRQYGQLKPFVAHLLLNFLLNGVDNLVVANLDSDIFSIRQFHVHEKSLCFNVMILPILILSQITEHVKVLVLDSLDAKPVADNILVFSIQSDWWNILQIILSEFIKKFDDFLNLVGLAVAAQFEVVNFDHVKLVFVV